MRLFNPRIPGDCIWKRCILPDGKGTLMGGINKFQSAGSITIYTIDLFRESQGRLFFNKFLQNISSVLNVNATAQHPGKFAAMFWERYQCSMSILQLRISIIDAIIAFKLINLDLVVSKVIDVLERRNISEGNLINVFHIKVCVKSTGEGHRRVRWQILDAPMTF